MIQSLHRTTLSTGSICAIYTRQSYGTKTDLTSCQVQFEACHSFLKSQSEKGWRWIGERFDDIDFSGATLERPALQKLLKYIHSDQINRILLYRIDRISRSLHDFSKLLKNFKDHEVDLIDISNPFITSDALSGLMFNVLATFAEFERDLIRGRIEDARNALKRRGRRIGGVVPFGYNADKITKQLVVNANEAFYVKEMFKMASEGMKPSEIAPQINQLGSRTKKNNLWSSRQVLAILSNPVYLGKFADGKSVRSGVHDVIITDELFHKARSYIKSRQTRTPSKNKIIINWPLKGKIRCGKCNRLMSTHMTRNGNIIYRYYRCRSNAGGLPPCKSVQISAGEIEKKAVEILATVSLITKNTGNKQNSIIMEKFQIAWKMLDERKQRELLSKVLAEIVWDIKEMALNISFNLECIYHFVNGKAYS